MKKSFNDVSFVKIKMQEQDQRSGDVKPKGRGRPRKPNMVKKLVKVDVTTYASLGDIAVAKSTTIASLLREGMDFVIAKYKA